MLDISQVLNIAIVFDLRGRTPTDLHDCIAMLGRGGKMVFTKKNEEKDTVEASGLKKSKKNNKTLKSYKRRRRL